MLRATARKILLQQYLPTAALLTLIETDQRHLIKHDQARDIHDLKSL
jgi:hypothetical protein